MPVARGPRPVTLRDFLDLGCESSSDGFRSYPRCRPCDRGVLQQAHVVEPKLSRSPSWSPSAFFLTKSPGSALARISSLSRSFSRRISFWSRREYDYCDDLDDRDSCGSPSPLVSSCSSAPESSEYAESETDIVIEETSAPVFEEVSASAGAAGDGHDSLLPWLLLAVGDGDPAEAMEDKQQLSPVSVLDFLFDDDDDDGDEEEGSDAGTCSPSFLQNLQRKDEKKKKARQQTLHKIRRFDCGPTTEAVDLPSSLTCSTDDSEEEHQSIEERSQGQLLQEPDEEYHHRLLARLLTAVSSSAAVDEISEWLLLDFFAEGISEWLPLGSSTANNKPLLHDGNKVTAALDWLRGAGPQWGIGDVMFSGESALKDMERSRRWMCVREEEQDVGAEVEALLVDGLLDEVVAELLAPCLLACVMLRLCE